MLAPQVETKEKVGTDLDGLNWSLNQLKKSIDAKEVAEDNSSYVSLIKEMTNNVLTLDDAKDTKIKDLLTKIDTEKKVTPQMIDTLVTKIIDIKLKILQDQTTAYTAQTETKHLQVEKLISQKDALNTLLKSINKTPTTGPTPTPESKSRFAKNRWRVVWGIGGLGALIGLSRSNKDEKWESKWVFSRIWRGIKYGAIAAGSALWLKYLIGEKNVSKAMERLGLEKPVAPNVTADDTNDTITWLTKDMEYSTDAGKTYIRYDGVTMPKFSGDQKVLVRNGKTDKQKESKTKEIIFTSATVPANAPAAGPEQSNLTPDELTKRNTYITDSINAATAFPIAINYGADKTALEAKWCPTNIAFDTASQSIKFGNDQLKVSVGEFTKTGTLDAKVSNVTINSIGFKDGKFSINVTGKAETVLTTSTETADVPVKKEQLLSMLTPYYQEKKAKYSVSLSDDEGTTVPITIEKIGWAPSAAPNTVPQTEYEKEYATLPQRQQSQYTDISNNVMATYGGMVSYAGTNNLPPLIKNYDPSVTQYLQTPWAIGYMMDKSFATVGDIISDSFLDKVSNTANAGIDYVAEFLFKYKENKYIGGVLGTVGWWLQGLLWSTTSEADIKSKLANDPEGLKRVSILIKQMAIVRFFMTEKKNLLKQQYAQSGMQEPALTATLEAKIDKVKITWTTEAGPSLYQTLKENNLLNTTLTPETSAGLVISKQATEIQKKIQETAKKTNFQWERGDLIFDYTTSTLTSRWKSTKLEISADNKVKIAGLDINFATVDQAVWFANATNRFMHRYYSVLDKIKGTVGLGGNILYRSGSGLRHGIFEDVSRNIDTRVLSSSTIEEHYPNWSDPLGEKYVAYLNKQIRSIGTPWVVDKVTSRFNE